MQYSAHAPFVASARERPQLWRLVVGLLLTALIYALGATAIFLLVMVWSGPEGASRWMREMAGGAGPTGTLLLLATFIGMALGPMAAVRLVHGRPVSTLFGPLPKLWRHFGIAAGICVVVYVATALIPTNAPMPLPNLPVGLWASFLPLAIVGVLLQTGAEEILFRGYLQQQLAARFGTPLVWMVLPSAVFALLHYQPEIMGDNTWLMMGAVFVFALLAADLTAATGSIGAAWGFHFVNNTLAILVVSMDGPLSGLALYTAPVSPASSEIRALFYLDIATMLAVWAIIRITLRERGS